MPAGITLLIASLLLHHGNSFAQQPPRLRTLASHVAADWTLGTITTAASHPGGYVVLLDHLARRIVVVDSSLRQVATFPPDSTRSSAFREPIDLDVSPTGQIAVLDRALGEVTLFTVRDSDSVIQVTETVPVGLPAEGICILPRGQFLIYGFRDGQRLHVIARNGETRSFAPAAEALSPMANGLVTTGVITCDRTGHDVIVTSRLLASVELYDIDSGNLMWEEALVPIRPLRLRDRRGEVSISSGIAGYTAIRSAFSYDHLQIVQAVYDARRDNVTADSVVTYVYAADRGEWMPLRFDLPLLFPIAADVFLSGASGPGYVRLATHHLLLP